MSELVMPRLSDTMEEGTVLRWLKRDGEHVKRGEELVEIETDKATMTYESDLEGMLHTVASEGDTLAVGEPIARIGEPDGGGADIGLTETARASDAGPPHAHEPREGEVHGGEPDAHEPREAEIHGGEPDAHEPREGEVHEGEPDAHEPRAAEIHGGEPDGRVKASPLARRIARKAGIDLTTLSGSGPGGRIVKADVEASAAASTGESPPSGVASAPSQTTRRGSTSSAAPQELASAKGETSSVELTRTQRTIARRMAESKATIPDFTLTAEVDMERCVESRAELKRLAHADTPTYNDMIVKACALALREHPRANGSYRDGRFELHSRVNVGVAVAVASENPTGGALVVPTVFDADAKALGEIARETRTLAERVRDGTVTPPELSGGTFTVSNLGMYSIRSFTAIVNPPQAAILAIGELAPHATIRKRKVVARQTMSITLSCDHRILYGADAALFLARIRELLEEPAALTL
jgi:pyruvate dehydrogenase E2 component (dihydrolipoamide acetyltransferase)